MAEKQRNIPTAFVVFGATGDLVEKRVYPSFFHLFTKNKLPKLFQVIGFSRRDITDDAFRDFVKNAIKKHVKGASQSSLENFLKAFSYCSGTFDEPGDYVRLAEKLGNVDGLWNVCSNKLFYLAVPPRFYETIFENLSHSHLTDPCSPEEGWTRVLVEKPFGKDLATARSLDEKLGKLFREEQVYRIDHYLGKEMVQNILSFRFANNLFEDVWNNKHIEKIEVRILEKMGVDGRGEFYDGVGALRDVGQNHLLQMLALVTMDQPRDLVSEQVREQRSRLLDNLKPFSKKQCLTRTLRAQYDGYKSEQGVSTTSKTETYFRVLAEIKSKRWSGVPIVLEGGKKMGENRKEIVVTFKHPQPCFCPDNKTHEFKNVVRFSLDPENKISVRFWAKKPGFDFEMTEKSLDFSYGSDVSDFAQEYERLLLDTIEGNQLLFVSTDEVISMWEFIDPIAASWNKNLVPLAHYKQNDKSSIERIVSVFEEKLASSRLQTMEKEITVIGLGKMGGNIALRLVERGWCVHAYNRSSDVTRRFEEDGVVGMYNLKEIEQIASPRVVLLSLPSKVLDAVLFDPKEGIAQYLEKGDIVVDAGNSFYKDTVARAKRFAKHGVTYIDVGVSGGPGGARDGACLMIGGDKQSYEYLKPLFSDMAAQNGEQFFEGAGAGHFVKMIHNGIEYGMMQAIAEGFGVLKKSKYRLDLMRVADIYNNGSVIESRLVGWLQDGFELYGEELEDVSGTVAHTGEGQWTVETAKELGVKAKIIEESLAFRVLSKKNPDYVGKIVSTLRNQFGGHSVSKK